MKEVSNIFYDTASKHPYSVPRFFLEQMKAYLRDPKNNVQKEPGSDIIETSIPLSMLSCNDSSLAKNIEFAAFIQAMLAHFAPPECLSDLPRLESLGKYRPKEWHWPKELKNNKGFVRCMEDFENSYTVDLLAFQKWIETEEAKLNNVPTSTEARNTDVSAPAAKM